MMPAAPAGESVARSARKGGGGAHLDEPLERLALVADAIGAQRIAAEARELAERVAEGRFYVACIGQFKRGKSTLLNALAGDAVLPAGVVPVTTLPTVLRYGPSRAARIFAQEHGWREVDPDALCEYVSQELNPGNEKQVSAVEVFLPAPLLAGGMCLVDTPGLGSVFDDNTAVTHDLIPHIDAALVVIGADPPLAGDELALVEKVARQVRHLVVVLNKADRVGDEERAEATAFARRVLEQRLGRPVERIFETSAIERLEGGRATRDWLALVDALSELAGNSGHVLTNGARDRGLHRLARQLLAMLDAERRALLRPLEETRQRMGRVEEAMDGAERALEELSASLMREQDRLVRDLAGRRDAFLRETVAGARTRLATVLAEPEGRRWGPARRRDAMEAAQDVAKSRVLPWLAVQQGYAEAKYRQSVSRFIAIANDFLERLAVIGGSELAELPTALDPERGFRTRSSFQFHDLLRIAHPASPLRYLADVIVGVAGMDGIILRQADTFLVRLMAINASRVENDIKERIAESRRQLEADIRLLLRDVRMAAGRVLESARLAHEAGAAAMEESLRSVANREKAAMALLPSPGAPERR